MSESFEHNVGFGHHADWTRDKRYFEEIIKDLKKTQEKHGDVLNEIKATILQAKTAVVAIATFISAVIGAINWAISHFFK